jgi:hypothetical protein
MLESEGNSLRSSGKVEENSKMVQRKEEISQGRFRSSNERFLYEAGMSILCPITSGNEAARINQATP